MTDNYIIEEAIRLVKDGVSVTLPVNGNSFSSPITPPFVSCVMKC